MSNCVKLGFENNPNHPYHQGHSPKHSPSRRIVHGKVEGLGHVEIHASSTRGHVIVPFAASIFKMSSQLRLRTLPGLKSGIHTCWPNCLNKSLLAKSPHCSTQITILLRCWPFHVWLRCDTYYSTSESACL